MTRRLLIILLLLVLGAIINVAVAWGCIACGIELGLSYGMAGEWFHDAQGNFTGHASYGFLRSAGLPMRSMERYFPEETPLTLHPLWPGFGVLWLLFAGPFVLRRWRRIRRGLCPKCAYDLRNRPTDSSACPECGAAVIADSKALAAGGPDSQG